MTVSDDVARLLQESLTAHKAAMVAREQKQPARNRELLTIAKARRLEAHDLDPAHTVPAWQDEQPHTPNHRDTHTDLLAFYAQQGIA